jgi:hypothetical protein
MVVPWQLQHRFVEELINFEILIQQKENILEQFNIFLHKFFLLFQEFFFCEISTKLISENNKLISKLPM